MNSFIHSKWGSVTFWTVKAGYYYLILLALFFLYFVLKQHNTAPFIYNNF
ncbi:teichoic acid D-Ala incorporation-associated protein DltX [Paradesulfitobacterium ferrireducens]